MEKSHKIRFIRLYTNHKKKKGEFELLKFYYEGGKTVKDMAVYLSRRIPIEVDEIEEYLITGSVE